MATLATSVRPFTNEPLLDFRREENQRAMRAALAKVRSELGREYGLTIGGERVHTAEKIRSVNPASPGELVGLHQKAGHEQVEPAMQAALAGFETWKNTAAEERAG